MHSIKSIIEAVPDPMIVLDKSLCVKTANKSFYCQFKILPEQTEGELLYDLGQHQWDIPALRKMLEAVWTQKTSIDNFELCGQFPGIGERTLLLNARIIDEDVVGERMVLMGLKDITKHKQAQIAFDFQWTFLETIFEHIDAGLVACNEDGELVLFNRKARDWHGLDPRKIPQTQWASYYDLYQEDGTTPMDISTVPLARAFRGETMQNISMVIAAKGQPKRYIMANAGPVKGKDGRVLGAVAVMHDITEHRRMEEGIREAQHFADEVIRAAGEGIIVYDTQLCYKVWNSAMEQMTGMPAAQVLGKKATNLFPHIVEQGIDKLLARAMLGQTVISSDFEYRVPGTEKKGWAQGIYTPHRDNSGNIIGVIAMVREITERKKAEETLKESEMRFASVFHHAPISIAITRFADGKILEVNDAFFDIFVGHTRQEIVGNDLVTLNMWVYPGHRVMMVKMLSEKGRVERLETQFRRKSGEIRDVFIVAELINLKGEQAIIGIIIDITESKRAERMIIQRGEELSALNILGRTVNTSLSLDKTIKTALAGIRGAVDADLTFLFLRDGERLVLKESLPVDLGRRFGVIPEHRVGECLCGSAVREKKPLYSRDIFTDGRCTWQECKRAGIKSFVALPLTNGDEIIGVMGLASDTMRDFDQQSEFLETLASQVSVALVNAQLYEKSQQELSGRKRIEEALRIAKEEAETANRYKTEFLTNISHDLRTPLNAILGISHILKSVDMEEKYRKGVDFINERGKYLLALVEDILNASKIDLGKAEFKSEELDLHQLLAEAVETAQVGLGKKDVTVSLSFEGTIPRLKGDVLRVRQIIDNLLSNAFKYTLKGRIQVTAGIDDHQPNKDQYRVRVSVKDTGIGIPEAQLPYIFDPFTRFHEFYKGQIYDGVGLGLHIAQKLAVLMGGQIRVLSQIDKGSEFIVTFNLDKI